MEQLDTKANSEKKVVFTKEIDSKISGFAIAFSFISVGILLLCYPGYFGNSLMTTVFRWVFIFFGIIGLAAEIGKTRSDSAIKGIDDLVIGLVLLGLWLVCFLLGNSILNMVALSLLVFGLYGTSRGVMEVVYSFSLQKRRTGEAKGKAITDILLLVTQLASFALVILQLVKALKVS